MLDRIDALVSMPFHYVLKTLCGITGKSNFFFAKLTLGMATICLIIFLVPFTYSGLGNALLRSLGLCFFCISLYGEYLNIRIFEKHHDSAGEVTTFAMPESDWREYQIGRTMIALASFVGLCVTHGDGFLAYMFLLATTRYFTTDFHPRKKSWVRHGLESLVTTAKKLRVPSVLPGPQPVLT